MNAPDSADSSGSSDGDPVQEFDGVDLTGARFVRADLNDVVMRAVDINGVDIDAPWLLEGENTLHVNGVDVVSFVESELNRRFPGRADRHAADPEALRTAWARLQQVWDTALERVLGMPAGAVDVQVAGEWSFAQTLRHLVMATDTWWGRAILEIEQPYHPLGQPNLEYGSDGHDGSIFSPEIPSYADVLDVRADRVAMVGEFLAAVSPDELTVLRTNPWDQQHQETTLSCLHTILEEEWEHHRYAVRDLDIIQARAGT